MVGTDGADQEVGQPPFLGKDRADFGVIQAEKAALGFGEAAALTLGQLDDGADAVLDVLAEHDLADVVEQAGGVGLGGDGAIGLAADDLG